MASENQTTTLVKYDEKFVHSQRDVQKVEVERSPGGFRTFESFSFFCDGPPGSGKTALSKIYDAILNRAPITVEAREAPPSADTIKVSVKQTTLNEYVSPFINDHREIKIHII